MEYLKSTVDNAYLVHATLRRAVSLKQEDAAQFTELVVLCTGLPQTA